MADTAPRPIPVRYDAEARRVSLLELSMLHWEEPFFDDMISRARRESLGAAGIELDLAGLARAADRHGCDPALILFHVGRCGSALLANLLAASGKVAPFKEPGVAGELMAEQLGAQEQATARYWARAVAAAIRLTCRAAPDGLLPVVKPAAWSTRCISALRYSFPDVPFMFLLRDPHEVVASLLFNPPTWAGALAASPVLRRAIFPSLAAHAPDTPIAPVALFAHGWRSIVEAALAMPAATLPFVDYADLTRDPARVLGRVLAHIGAIADTAAVADIIQTVMPIHAKAPGEKFDPAVAHRRPALSPLARAVVEDIVSDLRPRLAQRARSLA